LHQPSSALGANPSALSDHLAETRCEGQSLGSAAIAFKTGRATKRHPGVMRPVRELGMPVIGMGGIGMKEHK
jgi:hypothetical protein